MKQSDILALSTEDIKARILEEKAALSKLKFAHAVSAIENPNRMAAARKTIARLHTELTARKAAEKQETTETAADA